MISQDMSLTELATVVSEALEQAVLVAREQSENIDWSALRRWLKKEGIETAPEVRLFLERTDTI